MSTQQTESAQRRQYCARLALIYAMHATASAVFTRAIFAHFALQI